MAKLVIYLLDRRAQVDAESRSMARILRNRVLTPEEQKQRDEELDRLCPRLHGAELVAFYSGPPPPWHWSRYSDAQKKKWHRPGNLKKGLFGHMTPEQQRVAWEKWNARLELARQRGEVWTSQRRASIIASIGSKVMHPDRARRFIEIRQRRRMQYSAYRRVYLPKIVRGKLGAGVVKAAKSEVIEGL
jgi:hypothetical protein